ncbi:MULTISPECIES: winged helix DNA-binding protein [unclassified Mesorhizobium]|uniref:winged helix DNA-binding protein n=1 Tax=unclassified Mesorhizobium TaxID=325217 RepID=UPI0019281839|nr:MULTISPECIES: winged helix DNA-binding protein [unclassified Mesorhizobium]
MARRNQQEAAPGSLDRTWHLARTPLEIDVAELEYALMRSFEAFGRWQAECLASVVDFAASGPENALLHIIRMNDRPKSIRDLAYMANREDIPNIQYSLRKLIKGGMVERSGSGRSGVTYEVTDLGRDVTDRYADVRAALLIDAVRHVPELAQRLEDAARTLELMTGIYAQAARNAATHRRLPGLSSAVTSAKRVKP